MPGTVPNMGPGDPQVDRKWVLLSRVFSWSGKTHANQADATSAASVLSEWGQALCTQRSKQWVPPWGQGGPGRLKRGAAAGATLCRSDQVERNHSDCLKNAFPVSPLSHRDCYGKGNTLEGQQRSNE